MDSQSLNVMFEEVWAPVVGLILGLWFLASIVNQCRFRWWTQISRFDTFNLLPAWSFFAPNPGRHDFHILYRDGIRDENSAWTEIAFASSLDIRWRWLWNPSRYADKAVNDLINGFFQILSREGGEELRAVMVSSIYISLLQLVMAQPLISEEADRRQFAILRAQDFERERRLEVVFVSETHSHADA
jgi:hypothetical protein